VATLIVIGLLMLAAGAAVGLGWVADTRDREYSMGRVLGHRPWEEDAGRYPDQSSAPPWPPSGPASER
jgi:hypothetical protein